MSALELGTPAANAKYVRALSQALTSLHKPTTIPTFTAVFSYCETSHALSTLSKEEANVLFPALQSALAIPHPYARTASLRATILTAKHAPPSVIADQWASLAMRVTSLLKSVSGANPSLTAQALATLSTLLAVGAPLALKGGQHKASVSTVCHSAVTHATRVLGSDNPTAHVALAAIALLFSVLHTAPRELRQGLSRLEAALWDKWLDHPMQRVRNAAAKLLAHLLACCPDKVKQKVFDERIQTACQQLDQILDVLDLFTPGDGTRKLHATLLRMSPSEISRGATCLSAEQLSRRYSAVSKLLRELLEQTCSVPLLFPLPALLHTLCRGIADRQIDLYTPGLEGITLNADDATFVLASTGKDSLSTLVVLIESAHRGAALPYAQVVARAFQRRLSHVILRVRTKDGVIASILERCALYDAMSRLVVVLGSGFTEQVVQLFAELLEHDAKLYVQAKRTEETLLRQGTYDIPEATRSRKRRRGGHPNNRGMQQKERSAEVENGGHLAQLCGPETIKSVEKVLSSGIRVMIAMFENRGLLSSPAMASLQRLEKILEHLEGYSRGSADILEAVRAVALGGGSSRLQAEASPMLLQCLSSSKDVILSAFSSFEMQRVALRARASSESVLHPRGPPVLKTRSRNQEENPPEKSQSTERPPLFEAACPPEVDSDGETQQMDIVDTPSRIKKASVPEGDEVPSVNEEKPSSDAPRDFQRKLDHEVATDSKDDEEDNTPVFKRTRMETGGDVHSEGKVDLSLLAKDVEGAVNIQAGFDRQVLAPHSVPSPNAIDEANKGQDAERLSASVSPHQLSTDDASRAKMETLMGTEAKEHGTVSAEVREHSPSMAYKGGKENDSEDEEALIASLRFEQSDEE